MEFRAIYDAHVGFVFRTLNRFGVPERMLPDAVQEVFTVAFRSLDRFEGRSTMRTWLFGISRRIASDLRRSAPARREVLEGTSPDVPDSKSDLTVWGERNEALARAEAIVQSLPDEQRIVFALFEIEEWTGAEIAEATDVPIATVHSRLRLAREAVKRVLAATPEKHNAHAQAES